MSMGFHPLNFTFPKALLAVSEMSASTWEQKMELYSKWGWTEDDFWLAFRKNPRFIPLSANSFCSKMDFIVNKMGWQPADVAKQPNTLAYSLEKRIMPRASVIRILLLKNLLNDKCALATMLATSDKVFLDKYVIRYQDHVPELRSIFQDVESNYERVGTQTYTFVCNLFQTKGREALEARPIFGSTRTICSK